MTWTCGACVGCGFLLCLFWLVCFFRFSLSGSHSGSLGNVRQLARLETEGPGDTTPVDTMPVRHFGKAVWVGEDADGLGGTTGNAAGDGAAAGTTPGASASTTKKGALRLGKPRAQHSARREAQQKRRRRRGKPLSLKKARRKLKGIPAGFVGFRDTWFSGQGSLLDFEEDYKIDESSSSCVGRAAVASVPPAWFPALPTKSTKFLLTLCVVRLLLCASTHPRVFLSLCWHGTAAQHHSHHITPPPYLSTRRTHGHTVMRETTSC